MLFRSTSSRQIPLRQRYAEVLATWDEYVEPMIQLVNADGAFEQGVRKVETVLLKLLGTLLKSLIGGLSFVNDPPAAVAPAPAPVAKPAPAAPAPAPAAAPARPIGGSEYAVKEGDTLALTEAQDGVRLSATNPEFAKSMAVFESLSRRYRNTLRELAK